MIVELLLGWLVFMVLMLIGWALLKAASRKAPPNDRQ